MIKFKIIIIICQGGDYATGCQLDYSYFKKHYKMIALDLSKKQVLNCNPKATNYFYWKSRSRRKNNNVFHY